MDTFTKQPDEILDYDIDAEEWFEDLSGDYIASVAVSYTGDDEVLTLGPGDHSVYALVGEEPVRAKVWIGGGTDGVRYTVTAVLTTVDGRVKEKEFRIRVRAI